MLTIPPVLNVLALIQVSLVIIVLYDGGIIMFFQPLLLLFGFLFFCFVVFTIRMAKGMTFGTVIAARYCHIAFPGHQCSSFNLLGSPTIPNMAIAALSAASLLYIYF